jgi:hypothetical protein
MARSVNSKQCAPGKQPAAPSSLEGLLAFLDALRPKSARKALTSSGRETGRDDPVSVQR